MTSDHDALAGNGPLINLKKLSTRDRVRAVLHAGERQGHWEVIGRHEGSYLLQPTGGEITAMTEQEILDWPVQYFITRKTT